MKINNKLKCRLSGLAINFKRNLPKINDSIATEIKKTVSSIVSKGSKCEDTFIGEKTFRLTPFFGEVKASRQMKTRDKEGRGGRR
jgi:hypothetical protein